ncbi:MULTISPECIES: hypothetical protein [unclassified Brenneria]|uniref:hypothetical protein n=1 Tax=unclassified Brenneria TaxID=2634434 RepID=UPI0029C2D462|nr:MULTISPECIES: hypothetical protein [unclassified Brenneria]MDX5631006.1 hypothetical protein [Brenneria sp. L3-3Z]MDX5698087.1 hypothetical protein [Brenneria sp. L4-2C]
MNLLKNNKEISLSGEEAINILIEVEYMLISLRDIARHYYDNPDGEINAENRALYCEETTKFIDENEITKRLAKIRGTITEKFNLELGDDDMDDIERAMENITYWKPNDLK